MVRLAAGNSLGDGHGRYGSHSEATRGDHERGPRSAGAGRPRYTRERFDDTYNWTVKWNMTVPGATYETVVDNRAWQ